MTEKKKLNYFTWRAYRLMKAPPYKAQMIGEGRHFSIDRKAAAARCVKSAMDHCNVPMPVSFLTAQECLEEINDKGFLTIRHVNKEAITNIYVREEIK